MRCALNNGSRTGLSRLPSRPVSGLVCVTRYQEYTQCVINSTLNTKKTTPGCGSKTPPHARCTVLESAALSDRVRHLTCNITRSKPFPPNRPRLGDGHGSFVIGCHSTQNSPCRPETVFRFFPIRRLPSSFLGSTERPEVVPSSFSSSSAPPCARCELGRPRPEPEHTVRRWSHGAPRPGHMGRELPWHRTPPPLGRPVFGGKRVTDGRRFVRSLGTLRPPWRWARRPRPEKEAPIPYWHTTSYATCCRRLHGWLLENMGALSPFRDISKLRLVALKTKYRRKTVWTGPPKRRREVVGSASIDY